MTGSITMLVGRDLAKWIRAQRWTEPWKEPLARFIEERNLDTKSLARTSADEMRIRGFGVEERMQIWKRLQEGIQLQQQQQSQAHPHDDDDDDESDTTTDEEEEAEGCESARTRNSNHGGTAGSYNGSDPLTNLYLLSSQLALVQQQQQQHALIMQQAALSQLTGTLAGLQNEVTKRSQMRQQQQMYNRLAQQLNQQQLLQQQLLLQTLPSRQKRIMIRQIMHNRQRQQEMLIRQREEELLEQQQQQQEALQRQLETVEGHPPDQSNEDRSSPPCVRFTEDPKGKGVVRDGDVGTRLAISESRNSRRSGSPGTLSLDESERSLGKKKKHKKSHRATSSSSSSSEHSSPTTSPASRSSTSSVSSSASSSTSGAPVCLIDKNLSGGSTTNPWWSTITSHYQRVDRRTIATTRQLFPYERRLFIEGSGFVAISISNEPWTQVESALLGAMQSMPMLNDAFGASMGHRLVVFAIFDGRSQMHETTLNQLINCGLVDRLSMENDQPNNGYLPLSPHTVHCHYSRLMYRDPIGKGTFGPVHFMTLIKASPAGKLDSHHLFLHGLCSRTKPEYVFLYDATTTPAPEALFKLYDELDRDPRLGGCAGEVRVEPDWWNPLVGFQLCEYKMIHVLDRALENLLGLVTILPGALAGYRYAALTQADYDRGESPLTMYFVGLKRDVMSPFQANVYMAEDRILCFELLARKGTSYILRYVPESFVTTQVPTSMSELLKQRKRWTNGKLFALIYAFGHVKQFIASGLSWHRKATMAFQTLVAAFLVIISLLAPSIYFAWFQCTVVQMASVEGDNVGFSNGSGYYFTNIISYAFLFVLLLQVIFGIGNTNPQAVHHFYLITILSLSLFQATVMAYTGVWIYERLNTLVLVTVPLILGSIPVASIIHNPSDLLVTLPAIPFWIVLLPLALIVIPIRAYANINDTAAGGSIGHGGSAIVPSTMSPARRAEFEKFRSVIMLFWLTANALIAIASIQLQNVFGATFADWYIQSMLLILAFLFTLKLFALVVTTFRRFFRSKRLVQRTKFDDTAPPLFHDDNATTFSRALTIHSVASTRLSVANTVHTIPANDLTNDDNTVDDHDQEGQNPNAENAEDAVASTKLRSATSSSSAGDSSRGEDGSPAASGSSSGTGSSGSGSEFGSSASPAAASSSDLSSPQITTMRGKDKATAKASSKEEQEGDRSQ